MKIKKPSHRVVKFFYYLLVILVIAASIQFFKMLALPLVLSVFLAMLLDPLVNYCEMKGLSRVLTITLIFIFTTLAITLTSIFLGPKLVKDAQTIAQDLPKYQATLEKVLVDIQGVLEQKMPQKDVPDFVNLFRTRLLPKKGFNINTILDNLSGFFSLLSLIVIVPVVVFFFLVDGHIIQKAFYQLIPNSYFEMTKLLVHKIISALKLYFRGQMIDAAAVGIMTAVGLAIIQLPYFLVIGIIAGLGNLIPYLGPIIGFIPALFVILMSGEGVTFLPIIKLIIVFSLVQFIEGTFIYPIAVGKSVNLHPLVVIVGVTVGGQLGGIVGMLIAVPIISIVKVTFEVFHSYLKSYSII